ncbi:MAG TPA: energy transducer TonB [Nitrospirota bacterium]|nr:energy transducer TonB [Nitrospirota bacterium]
MRYQLAGLKVSLLIHAAVLTLIFSVSRLYVTSPLSVAIDIGILTSAPDAFKKDLQGQVVHQLKRLAKRMEVAKTVVPPQEKLSETPAAENPLSKQGELTTQKTLDEALNSGEAASRNSAAVVVGPVFDAAYLKNPKPQYPLIARRMKLEGTVILQVLVSSEGKPEIVRLGKSSGSSVLDQAALTAVQGWSFIPARQGNDPISAWVDVPLRFRLVD